MSLDDKTELKALTIGSDVGIFNDSVNPTTKRFLEYARQCGRHFTLCYTPPGYKKITIEGKIEAFPTNSRAKWLFPFDAFRKGGQIIKENSIDVLIVQDTFVFGFAGLLLKKRFSLPLVVHYHSGFYTNPYWLAEKPLHHLLKWLGLFVSCQADAIRTVSTDIRKDLIQRGFKPERVFYATPPVEAKNFLDRDPAKEKEIADKLGVNPKKTFVFIGRLSREKNLTMMVRATKEVSKTHPEIKLLLIGQGPEEATLRRMVSDLGLEGNVLFPGSIPYDDIKNYIRCGCALLISSFYEGTAKVIKEAAFSGRATLTTETSGVNDVIRNGETGLIVSIGNVASFAAAMKRLLEDPFETASMGQRARRLVLEHFVYERDVTSIIDVWKEAVARWSAEKNSGYDCSLNER